MASWRIWWCYTAFFDAFGSSKISNFYPERRRRTIIDILKSWNAGDRNRQKKGEAKLLLFFEKQFFIICF